MNLLPEVLENTLVRILKPLVKIMMRNGVSYGVFSELARKVFVDAGFDEVRRRSQKQTVSNVAIVTGLNRKEVTRLKDSMKMDPDHSLKKFNRIVRVLAGWQHDAEFLDLEHEPKDLLLDGETGSFTSLVKRFSGDMPVVAMLNLLIDSGNIKVIDNGNIQLINPNYLPSTDSNKKLDILGIDTSEFIRSIDHNIQVKLNEDAWFQRKASNIRVKQEALPAIRKQLARQGQQLLEDIDKTFSNNETEVEEESTSVSVGIYYFQEKEDQHE